MTKKHTKRCASFLYILVAFDAPSYDPCHCEERSDVGPKGMPVVQSPVSAEVPARFVSIFSPLGRKLWSCRHRAGGKQQSTGLLHLSFQICPSLFLQKEKAHQKVCFFFLLLVYTLDIAFLSLKTTRQASKNQIFRSQVSTKS